jgi:hypothetical protein
MTEPAKNLRISPEYQEEIEKIREEVKKGGCSTLKECLLLFEELWQEDHPSNRSKINEFLASRKQSIRKP